MQEVLNLFLNDKAFVTLFLEKTEQEKKLQQLQQQGAEEQLQQESAELIQFPQIPHLKKKEPAAFFILVKFLELIDFLNPNASENPITNLNPQTQCSFFSILYFLTFSKISNVFFFEKLK